MNQNGGIHKGGFAVLCHRNGGSESPGILSLIKRVEVYRDYKLHIDFNIDFTQFCEGLDIVTIAA